MSSSQKIVMVLGIRPDIIRACIFIKVMRKRLGKNFILIWSGQHYSENLKDIFFHQLGVKAPDIELGINGDSDAELVGNLLPKLSKVLMDLNPAAAIFLGDTNTVVGSIAAAQLNIPVIHIEGCMRSYDWRMPEEKYRKITDHLADLIFAYLPEYQQQGLVEGIPEQNIEISGNPIVDVLSDYFLNGPLRLTDAEFSNLKSTKYGLQNSRKYALMTSHRRENVDNLFSLQNIFELAKKTELPVIFPAGYRTQKSIKSFDLTLPNNLIMVDPIGYLEILELLTHAQFVLSDSGTLIEEACILGTPSIQMRHSTERPQVYTWGASVKFDPTIHVDHQRTIDKVSRIASHSWTHQFGDGNSSMLMVESIEQKLKSNSLSRHDPGYYSPLSANSFIGD